MTASRIPAIAKDASLIVIDGDRGLGNGCVFPAGPLRAPLPPQLARTDALIVIGDGAAAAPVAAAIAAQGKPVLSAHLRAGRCVGGRAARQARAGLCRHRRSRAGSSGRCAPAASRLSRERAFADHHPFSKAEIERLIADAQARRADAGDDGKGSGAAAQRRRDFRTGLAISCRSRSRSNSTTPRSCGSS